MSLTIAVPREIYAGEKRVAAVPEVVEKLLKLGFAVHVESGAGAAANFSDESYQAAGARIAGSAAELMDGADIVFKVRATDRRRDRADEAGHDARQLHLARAEPRTHATAGRRAS